MDELEAYSETRLGVDALKTLTDDVLLVSLIGMLIVSCKQIKHSIKNVH